MPALALPPPLLLPAPSRVEAGFSLLEMLVVMAIAGILVSLVSLAYRQDDQQVFGEQAEQLAWLFEQACDRAQMAGLPLRWQASAEGYYFEQRDQAQWQMITGHDLLRPRHWRPAGMRIQFEPANVNPAGHLDFPVELPCLSLNLSMFYRAHQLRIVSDGSGRFDVRHE